METTGPGAERAHDTPSADQVDPAVAGSTAADDALERTEPNDVLDDTEPGGGPDRMRPVDELEDTAPGDDPADRGWTPAEAEAEIARLGEVPLYGSRPAPDPVPTVGTTAAERLSSYGWLFGPDRLPSGPRPPLWRQPGGDVGRDGPATQPIRPVAAARSHPVAAAVPAPRRAAPAPATGQPSRSDRSVGAGRPRATARAASRRRGRRAAVGVLTAAVCLCVLATAGLVTYRLGGDDLPLAGLLPGGAPTAAARETPTAGRIWEGPVLPIAGVTASADCVDDPNRDGDQVVGYAPSNLLDGRSDTAWMCSGEETPRITFSVPEGAQVAEVGLVNGYAKDVDDLDRYPLYRRATLVRWTFADGTSITQELTDDTRTLQRLRVPVCAGGEITLDILRVSKPSVQSATKDAVALSTVLFSAPQG